MAQNPLEIVNSALIKLGAERIASLSDANKAARIANEQYNKIRKEVLASHPWNFAVARKELSLSVNNPEFEFSNMFIIPSDVLRILSTDLDEVGYEWKVETYYVTNQRVIVTNADAMKIRYIRNIEDTTLFSPVFEEAFAYRMATDFAYALTQSSQMQRQMFQLYQDTLSQARSFDAQESSSEVVEADEWILTRT